MSNFVTWIFCALSLIVPGDTFRYIIVAFVSASLIVSFVHRQRPSHKLGCIENALEAADEILEAAKANYARSHVELMDLTSRLLE
ncbi:hypothetical protein B0H19DRAFT_1153517 [Mycena capillaripes]|nr:hypothetical protein B0H19DRAFT_1153517 [Mycena capillaripes]